MSWSLNRMENEMVYSIKLNSHVTVANNRCNIMLPEGQPVPDREVNVFCSVTDHDPAHVYQKLKLFVNLLLFICLLHREILYLLIFTLYLKF